MSEQLPILYKYTSKGQAQQWQIVVDGGSFYTQEGIVDGKITTSASTNCKPKNIGKANETTPSQQARLEAKAKWQKKVDSGYNEVLTDQKNFLAPMLAFEYSKYPIDWKKEVGVYVQPKLDGVRCINDDNTQMSRNGKPLVSTPHLNQTRMCLDGELYAHKFKDNFNEIMSLVRKTKPTEEDFDLAAKHIQLWVYDAPHIAGNFNTRYAALIDWYNGLSPENQSGYVLVPTFYAKTEADLLELHAQFIAEGYEGTIVRRNDSNYEFKRSKQLLKYKDFKDEEFKIIGYEEGTGAREGSLGAFIMQHDTDPNKTFKSNVKTTQEDLKKIWENRDSYIGTTATVKYFNRTPVNSEGDGDLPRFPYIIKFDRSYE